MEVVVLKKQNGSMESVQLQRAREPGIGTVALSQARWHDESSWRRANGLLLLFVTL